MSKPISLPLAKLDDEGKPIIKCIDPGFTTITDDLAAHRLSQGRGINRLRTSTYVQPRALRYGDRLVTGEMVVGWSEAYNGGITVYLDTTFDGRTRTDDVNIAPRFALAIQPRYVELDALHELQEVFKHD